MGAPDIEQTGIGEPMKLGGKVMRARLIESPGNDVDDVGRVVPTVEIGEGRIADHMMRRLHRSMHFILSKFARQFSVDIAAAVRRGRRRRRGRRA